jgi:hypothetical protein
MTPEATSGAVSRSALGIFNSTSGWLRKKTLDDDTLRDQVERGDSDWLAAHQSIDDERPGFAENAGYGCAGLACDPVNAD